MQPTYQQHLHENPIFDLSLGTHGLTSKFARKQSTKAGFNGSTWITSQFPA
jgi:hypothetical protein